MSIQAFLNMSFRCVQPHIVVFDYEKWSSINLEFNDVALNVCLTIYINLGQNFFIR